jgi:hypothetical protein
MKRRGTCLEIYLKVGPTSNLFLNLMSFYYERFSKKKFIKWLTKLKVYFYFNKVPYQQNTGLIALKLSHDARE